MTDQNIGADSDPPGGSIGLARVHILKEFNVLLCAETLTWGSVDVRQQLPASPCGLNLKIKF